MILQTTTDLTIAIEIEANPNVAQVIQKIKLQEGVGNSLFCQLIYVDTVLSDEIRIASLSLEKLKVHIGPEAYQGTAQRTSSSSSGYRIVGKASYLSREQEYPVTYKDTPLIALYGAIGFAAGAALYFGYRALTSSHPYSAHIKSSLGWGLEGAALAVMTYVGKNMYNSRYA